MPCAPVIRPRRRYWFELREHAAQRGGDIHETLGLGLGDHVGDLLGGRSVLRCFPARHHCLRIS